MAANRTDTDHCTPKLSPLIKAVVFTDIHQMSGLPAWVGTPEALAFKTVRESFHLCISE